MSFKFIRLSPKLIKRIGWHFPINVAHHAHWCPACGGMHDFAVEQPFSNGARWGWDGSVVAPTFTPSMNIRIGPFTTEDGRAGEFDVCHYFLRGGRLEYLGDCTHNLKGQTVDLPDIPVKKLLGIEEIFE